MSPRLNKAVSSKGWRLATIFGRQGQREAELAPLALYAQLAGRGSIGQTARDILQTMETVLERMTANRDLAAEAPLQLFTRNRILAQMPKADFTSWPKLEEVAATILFLASPDNRVTRGGIVPVYGKS